MRSVSRKGKGENRDEESRREKVVRSVSAGNAGGHSRSAVQQKEQAKSVSFFVPFDLNNGPRLRGRASMSRSSSVPVVFGRGHVPNSRSVSSDEAEDREASLQEALRARRPAFVSRAAERQEVLAVRAFLRERALLRKRRRLLEGNGGGFGDHEDRENVPPARLCGGTNGSDSGLGTKVQKFYSCFFNLVLPSGRLTLHSTKL
jgi:hypothetical protein